MGLHLASLEQSAPLLPAFLRALVQKGACCGPPDGSKPPAWRWTESEIRRLGKNDLAAQMVLVSLPPVALS